MCEKGLVVLYKSSNVENSRPFLRFTPSPILKDILTRSPTHPHGIKARLVDGQVGRVNELTV